MNFVVHSTFEDGLVFSLRVNNNRNGRNAWLNDNPKAVERHNVTVKSSVLLQSYFNAQLRGAGDRSVATVAIVATGSYYSSSKGLVVS